jgi:DNA-binding transcriptional ArsR family regulator
MSEQRAAGGVPKTRRPSLDERLARALNHPLRAQLLSLLNERSASPTELTELVDAELPSVSYHVRELLKLGCVEVAAKEQVRGTIKTTYRATTRMLLDVDAWEGLSRETRNGITLAAVGETIDRARSAIEADTFDSRTDSAVINLRMDLDEAGWAEVVSIITDAYQRLEAVEAKVANRSPEPADRFRATVSILGYESPRHDSTR